MDDDGDLHEQILQIEAQIDELSDIIERCRKIILISKTAIAAGGTVILAIIFGVVGFDPTVLIGSIAAVIGGTVVFGSNTSTLNQTMIAMKAAEAHRAELISRLHLRIRRGRHGCVRQELAGVAMRKTTTPLTAEERVILFCTATGTSHAAVGITVHAMQSMAIKGFIVHDRESRAYTLTDSGRAALLAILGDAGLT